MDKRQIKLVKDYGPRVYKRCAQILDEFYYLPADALSVLTDEEWKECAEAMVKFRKELYKVKNLVWDRMEEAGVELK